MAITTNTTAYLYIINICKRPSILLILPSPRMKRRAYLSIPLDLYITHVVRRRKTLFFFCCMMWLLQNIKELTTHRDSPGCVCTVCSTFEVGRSTQHNPFYSFLNFTLKLATNQPASQLYLSPF